MTLEIDSAGMIVTRPVLGWKTALAPQTAVILQLHYSERPGDMPSGGKSLQVVLSPRQCKELAETLSNQAEQVLALKPVRPTN